MSIQAVVYERFEGGWSTDLKTGIENSQAYTQAFDFRKNPSQLSVLPAPRREDAGVIKDLVLNEVMTPNGTIYASGNQGFFYKRTVAGAWSAIGQLDSGAAGMDYRKDTDSIYLAGHKSVSLYNPVSGTASLTPDKYGISYSTYNNSTNAGFNVSAYQVNSTQTTAIAANINEGSGGKRFFQSDIEPLNKISVFIVDKGTGNWTLTLHDGLDNVLATSTVTNANLKNNQFNDFAFTSATNDQVRIYVAPNARTYHFHLTSTVADGSVSSSVSNDLGSCDVMIWADRLIQTTNGLHPMARFLQYEIIGNANYLSVWEPLSEPPTNAEWLRHRLAFPEEFEVCGVAVLNEYAAIACERIPDAEGNNQEGIIFWWDGLSPSWNYFTAIPEGSPYAIRQHKNVVYYYAGGAEYAIVGANSEPVKIRTLPNSDTEYSDTNSPITIYPYTSTTRRGVHLLAYPSSTTNTDIDYGVYSWGQVDKNYPNSFGYNYLISTGSKNYTAQNNLTIGMVKNFGDVLHISWRDDTNGGYGIDVVDNTSNPAGTAIWEAMIFDNGYTGKPKTGIFVDAYYDLPAGATIKLKYKLDRASSWTYSEAFGTTNLWNDTSNYARLLISGGSGRFREAQVGIEVTCDSSVTQAPVVYMVSFVFDNNKDEALV